jgi:hypothetical protein
VQAIADTNSLLSGLIPLAAAIGEAWAQEFLCELRAIGRDPIGAWPGTVREARSRVIQKLPAARQRAGEALDPDSLQLLARTTYDAARRSWMANAEPDLEP